MSIVGSQNGLSKQGGARENAPEGITMKNHHLTTSTHDVPAMIASVATTCLFLLIERLDELIGQLPDGYRVDFSLSFRETKNVETGKDSWVGVVSIEMIYRALQSEGHDAACPILTQVGGLEIWEGGKYRWLPYQPDFVRGQELDFEALAKAIETGIGRGPDDRVSRPNPAILLPSELPVSIDMDTMEIITTPTQTKEGENGCKR